MKPAPFTYQRPTSIADAVDALSEYGDEATILAGGQSLIPTMNVRTATPDTVIDINRIEALDYVCETEDEVRIGAMTRQSTVEKSRLIAEDLPLVSAAIGHVGHKTNRNRGTFGGNVAHADPSAELPAVSLVRDASFVARSASGERLVPAAEFFLGDTTTALRTEELLTEIRMPRLPERRGWGFDEVSPREGDLAMTGVAATLDVDSGVCRDVRLGYFAVSDRPLTIPAVEADIEGEPAEEETFRAAGRVAREELDPPSDVHADSDYRARLAETLTNRVLAGAAARAGGDGS
jgi:CO/xanthine dehydrogenase FAD-binding subunit